MNRGREDQWHNPSGWVLAGILTVYLAVQADWLHDWQTYCAVLWLLPATIYLLRHNMLARRSLFYTGSGALAAMISLLVQQQTDWPEDWPAREFHGQIQILQLFQPAERTSIRSGIATLVTAQHPLWQLLDGSRVVFYLESPAASRDPAVGETLYVRGVLRPQRRSLLPTGFEEYLDRRGVALRLHQGVIPAIPTTLPPLISLRQSGYDQLTHALLTGGDHRPREQSIYLAMLTGSRSYLSAHDIDLFVRSGTMHLFAISGLHIVIVASGIFVVLRLLRLPLLWQVTTGICLIGIYVWITGSAPSAIRAWYAVAIYWGGYALQRQPTPFRTLCLTAVITLLIDPSQLHHAGFQLSYAVVATLLLWGIPILRWLPLEQRLWRYIPWHLLHPAQRLSRTTVRAIWSTLIISVAATLGSIPLVAAGFQLITPGGIWINLPASFLAAGVIFAAMLSVSGHLMGMELVSSFFNQSAYLFLAILLLWIEQLVDRVGFVQTLVHPPTTTQATLLTIGGLLLLLLARHPLSWLHKTLLICYPLYILIGMSLFE